MLFAVVAVGLLVGALVLYVGNGVVAARQNSGNRLSALRTRDEALDNSFSERALAPVFLGLGRFALRFTPTGWVDRAQHKLVLAGWADRIDGNTWAAIRIIAIVAAFLLWLVIQTAIDGFNMKMVTLEGTLHLHNFESKPVDVAINAHVEGKPLLASDKGELTLDTSRLKLRERRGNVRWSVTLQPDERRTFTYKYERYVPSD